MSVGAFSIKVCMLIVLFDKRANGLNHDEAELLRHNVNSRNIKVVDAKRLRRWFISAKVYRPRKHSSIINHHLADSDVAYLGRFAAVRQKT